MQKLEGMAGNRTRISWVKGESTNHYTVETVLQKSDVVRSVMIFVHSIDKDSFLYHNDLYQ